jgi:thymidylate synthase
MRVYLTCEEAITDIGRELKKCATNVHTATYQNKVISDKPEFETKEIQAFQFAILDTSDKDQMPNVTLEWCKAEHKERVALSRINPGEAYKIREQVWDEFLVERMDYDTDEDPIAKREFDYTYNERISYQLGSICSELRVRPDTRQAIVNVHNNMLDLESLGGRKRIPCSVFYQFMIRDGKLDVIYIMRSSDFATHFQNDIWQADELRRFVARQVGVPIGTFIMMISSLHIFKKGWDLLKNY